MSDIQHTQMVMGTAMLIAALGTMVLSIAGRWIGGVWTTSLAILAALLLSYQPLIGTLLFADIKTYIPWHIVITDIPRRILLEVIPFTAITIALSFKKVPFFFRLIFAVVGPAILLCWVFQHFDVSTPRQTFFIQKIGPIALVIFIAWILIEPLAGRSPGAAVPIAIGPAMGGLAFLLMLSAETQAGQLAPIIPATALGALLASIAAFFLGKPIAFARGPVLLWLTLMAALFAFTWLDTDELPTRYLYWIATAPLLAWVPEIGPIRRLKPWKRESIRLILVAIPVIAAAAMAFKEHKDKAKADGDEFGMNWSVPVQPAAPMRPSAMPIPNTINPPTIT